MADLDQTKMQTDENEQAAAPSKKEKPKFLERDAEFIKIMHLYKVARSILIDPALSDEDVKNNIVDLDVNTIVSGALSTAFHTMRKQANRNEGATGKINLKATVKGQGTRSSSIENIINEYRKLKYPEFQYMVATALVDSLTSFKLLWDEVRVSAAKFKLKIGNGEPKDMKLHEIGLTNVHLPYLNGLTFKPERRSGLMKTLGPLTQAVLLGAEQNRKEKLTNALNDSLKLLPMGPQIVECCADAKDPRELKSLYRALGDVLLLSGARTSNRIHFPAELFYVCTLNELLKDETLYLTGANALVMYNKLASKVKIKATSCETIERLSQVTFHAMFDTSTEDMSVLSQITEEKNWYKRKELGNLFKISTEEKTFNLIKYRYFSKLASSSMVKSSDTMQPMLNNKIVFAGHRKRNYSGNLIRYLETGESVTPFGKDSVSLTFALTTYKERMLKIIRSGENREAGTVKWQKLVGEDLVETDFVPEEKNDFFYS